MFSAVVDLVIGLVLVFFLLSLVTSGVNEVISKWLNRRSRYLVAALGKLLGGLTPQFLGHPLIQGLAKNADRPPSKPATVGTKAAPPNSSPEVSTDLKNLPSYIPARTFALAVISLVAGQGGEAPAPSGGGGEPTTADMISKLQGWITSLPEDHLRRSLQLLLTEAGNDFNHFLSNVETWFDDAMDRVSGWYKRKTKRIMLIIGLGVAVALNADTLLLGKTLWNNGPLRDSIVAQAQNAVDTGSGTGTPTGTQVGSGLPTACSTSPAPTPSPSGVSAVSQASLKCVAAEVKTLKELQIPLGWSTRAGDPRVPHNLVQWLFKILGLLLTAMALSMGAPFWFDLLNKVVNFRLSGAPPPKSADATPPPAVPIH